MFVFGCLILAVILFCVVFVVTDGEGWDGW